jgi:hypothetical protein
MGSATRLLVQVFGGLVSFAGLEHGVGAIVQGGAPDGLVFESWPDHEAIAVIGGEPAFTVLGDLAVAGALTIVVALAVGIWSIRFVDRPRAGWVLVALSVVLFVVGGGFGPPLVGIVVGVAAERSGRPEPWWLRILGEDGPRRVAALWPGVLVVSVAAFLAMFPGVLVWGRIAGAEAIASVLGIVAFLGLVGAVLSSRAADLDPADASR